MKNSAKLLSHLRIFEKYRQEREEDLKKAISREKYAEVIAECFTPCAQAILAGYFKVVNTADGNILIRKIQPTVLELYYHEEKDGGFRDPIMYHTDYRKRTEKKAKGETYFSLTGLTELPYYPIGSLNPHTSGIDVTFENAQEKYRASFLIRAYSVTYENGKTRTVDNSTEIYDDLLLNGITLDSADWIEWVDGTPSSTVVTQSERKNVSAYEKYNDSPELWRKVVIGHKADNKPIFAKCKFLWQFVKK